VCAFGLPSLLHCAVTLIRAYALPIGLALKGSGGKLRFGLLSSAPLFARAIAEPMVCDGSDSGLSRNRGLLSAAYSPSLYHVLAAAASLRRDVLWRGQ
jgi:hypothetical protein